MTSPQEALAHRAVACPGWRWMPGMAVTFDGVLGRIRNGANGSNFLAVDASQHRWISIGAAVTKQAESPPDLPDLSDPATLGCLLALVREAWGQRISVVPLAQGAQWHALKERNAGGGLVAGSGSTEAAALVAALEAAGRRE